MLPPSAEAQMTRGRKLNEQVLPFKISNEFDHSFLRYPGQSSSLLKLTLWYTNPWATLSFIFGAVLLESWAISILRQSVEHLGLEELEVILWTKGTLKGQTINKKVRNWKAKLNFFITNSWPESCFLPSLPHPQTSMTSFDFLLAKVATELLIGLNVS